MNKILYNGQVIVDLDELADKYTKSEVDALVSSVFKYKGTVATKADLNNIVDMKIGDCYNVEADGCNYAWNGEEWSALSGTVDLTNYYTKEQVDGKFGSYLPKNNAAEYTPTDEYNPATKKYVDDKVLDAIPQKSTMPEASADYLNKIYQYIGEETENYKAGFFYQCLEFTDGETTSYSWNEISFNTGSGETQYAFPMVTVTGTLKAEGGNSYDPESKSYSSTVGNELLEKLNEKLSQGIKKVIVRFLITDNSTIPYLDTILTMTSTYPSYSPIIIPRFIDDVSYLTPQMQFPLQMVDGRVTNRSNSSDVIRIYSWMNSNNNKTVIATANNVLTKTNTTEFTPSSDYHPATKKYVDDTIANADTGGGQDDLGIHVITSNFGGSNPYWADAGSDVAVKFMEKLTELYKSGAPVSTIRIHTDSTATAYWECRVGFNGNIPNIEPVMTFVYDGDGNITQTRKANFVYGTFYYDADSQSFKHSGGNAIAFFTSAGDPGIYTKSSDVLTKANTTEYTPTGDYHPATKKYVDNSTPKVYIQEEEPTNAKAGDIWITP